jgi:hypothetical protein
MIVDPEVELVMVTSGGVENAPGDGLSVGVATATV